MTTFGRLSRLLNRVFGGAAGQTLCARIAARNPECWFCRLVGLFTTKDHCAIELARWQRRGMNCARRVDK